MKQYSDLDLMLVQQKETQYHLTEIYLMVLLLMTLIQTISQIQILIEVDYTILEEN